MKIKYILLGTVLASMLMTGTAMAEGLKFDTPSDFSGAGYDPSATPDFVDTKLEKPEVNEGLMYTECKEKEISIVKGEPGKAVAVCEDGTKYCKDNGGFRYDSVTKSCYEISQSTILPYTPLTVAECESLYSNDAKTIGLFKNFLSGKENVNTDLKSADLGKTTPATAPTYTPDEGRAAVEVLPMDVLGCGIKTGRMKLWMIPYYIKSLIEFALSIAGLVAVGAMVAGGYFYLFGTLMDDKEKGKRAVIYGIGGFVVVLLAWAVVNIVISIATL